MEPVTGSYPREMTIKAKDFDHIVEKLQLKIRDSQDRLAWFEYEGRLILRTRRSHKKGELPFQHSIRQQLKLNEDEFRKAVKCCLSRDEYVEILKRKGYL